MADSAESPSKMLGSIAAQLMILYDDAVTDDRSEAAEAYAMALNVVRNESEGVEIVFDGPPPTVRTVPRKSFPENLAERLAPMHRPS
jgi:hypothetical protein